VFAVYCDKMTKVTQMQTTNIVELVTKRRELCCPLANADELMNQMRAIATSKLPPYRDF